MEKKPDNVVFNSDTNTYDAFLKPYATSFTAPAIKAGNAVNWKNQQIKKANSQFYTIFNEIKEQYNALQKQHQYNEIIYNAKFNFQPIVGELYHLYKRKNQEFFLSILAPEECNFNFVGSFQLNSDQIWMKKQ
ncbi:DUF2452 domain-containing protein [Tenacibaculum soleae]|uniref:GTP-binding protein n=1 Tax=Tenacibaculum soleae TaxID=447689 RepID=A0A1B9Y2M0_9FLAO|nr:DUF2452 domain-containing protein [Tenacibaculum soleae]MDO6812843.1 DUF2452 domain-containing protein [Tenacibaculum soleae]OCK43951.1 GTP-binding protein [Tenacibaculum soleae]